MSVIWSQMIHVFRISALNDKDTSMKLIHPAPIVRLFNCFSRTDPLKVRSEHTGEENPTPEMGLLPLQHCTPSFRLNPLQILLLAWDFYIIPFHIFAARFHPWCSSMLFFTTPCCTTSNQGAKKRVRQNKAYCLQEKTCNQKIQIFGNHNSCWNFLLGFKEAEWQRNWFVLQCPNLAYTKDRKPS